MAQAGVVAVLLPTTAYSLQKAYAPGREMVEPGLPIATDCNPGNGYTESMPFVFGLSVLNMRLSVSEALVAEDAFYDVGFMNEADDFHLMATPGTTEGVNFPDLFNELSPGFGRHPP